ncbi:MAG: L-lactate dehydrogenase [Christensenellaceae bacterium]|nr:L-lactate dehydrogenase [Christensenellaceae bacterium]
MNKATNKSKVVVIGAGKVGATVAYTIMMNKLASEIVLLDVDRNKARGEALDISHGIAYFKQLTIRDGDYADCADADVIVLTAGIPRKPGQTRLDLARTNVAVTREIVSNVMKHADNPLFLVISNPVDVLTYVVQKESGLPASRVIGSGTTLDTGRFRYFLSQHCKVDVRDVHAYIIGEHGDNSVPVWSRASIASKPFDEYCEDCPRRCLKIYREHIFEQTRNAGTELIKFKGATFYGVALAVTRIIGAFMGDENSVFTVSSVLDGNYGISDVALSLPCILNRNGIDRYLDIRISDEERLQLQESANKLKAAIRDVYLPVVS